MGGEGAVTNEEIDHLVLMNVPGVYSFCKHDVSAKQIILDGKFYARCNICGFFIEVLEQPKE